MYTVGRSFAALWAAHMLLPKHIILYQDYFCLPINPAWKVSLLLCYLASKITTETDSLSNLPKCVIFLFLDCDQHLSNITFSFCLSHRSHFFAVFHWYTAVLYHISLCFHYLVRYDQGTSESFITSSITS